MNIPELLAILETKTQFKPRRDGQGWKARCPAHEDKEPSLSIGQGNAGRILLRCHAGCAFEAVASALGIKPGELSGNGKAKEDSPQTGKRRMVATYDYQDERGKLLFQVCRFEPKDFRQRRPDPSAKDGWQWKTQGVRRVLFRLPELLAAVKTGQTVFVAEGEKDVLALVKHGFPATCNAGGAGKWQDECNEPLRGAAVVICADKDAPGREHAAAVAGKLKPLARSVKVLELPDTGGKPVKDAADFFAAGGTAEVIRALAGQASEWDTSAAPKEAPPPPFYYHKDKGDYWRQKPDGEFVKTKEDDLKRHLRWGGFRIAEFEGPFGVNKFDAAIVRAQNEAGVDHVIALAGHKAGIYHTEDGRRILIPRTPPLIAEHPGTVENFDRLFSELFGPEQTRYALAWLKLALEDRQGLDPARWRHHQMLALVGKPDCGKSFFQMLVSSLLGGREADPYLWMVQKTDFNEDLAEAEHWKMEDKNAHRDAKSRAAFGGAIKQATVSHALSVHGKGKKQIVLTSFRRLTISINDDPEYITVLPMLDGSVADKISILKCGKATMLPDWKENRARFVTELPAFARFLLRDFAIPPELQHGRFGVKTFHAPEVVELLQQFEPHLRLLEIIDAALFNGPGPHTPWIGNSTELQKELCAGSYETNARQLLNYSTACGVHLSKLAEVRADRVTKSRVKGNHRWTIAPPR